MRRQPDGVIMMRSAEPEWPRSDLLQNLDKRGNAGIVRGPSFFYRGSPRLQSRNHVFGRFGNQRVGVLSEKIGIGGGDAGQFPARHGMAAEEQRALFTWENFGGSLSDTNFGAASVGDQRMRRGGTRTFRKKIDGPPDTKSPINQSPAFHTCRNSPTHN